LACSTDATADFNGYFLVLLQNLCSATSLTFSKESQLTCVQLVYFNSFAASIICSILAISFETKLIAQQFLYLKDPFFLGLFFCMCCVCVFYQFSIFICTIQNSPLATSVTGNIKDLMSTFFGFILFQDTKYNQWNLLGIGFSFFGAYSFSYLKYQMTISSSSSSSSVSSSSFSSFSFSLKKEKKEISSSDKATAS
jgi:solute carrier family 35 protein